MGREGMGTDPIIVVLDQKRLDGPWSVVVIAANSHGNPAFGAGPWALCLAVLHTHALGEEVRSQSQCGWQSRSYLVPFSGTLLLKARPTARADIIGTFIKYPSSRPCLAVFRVGPAFLYSCMYSFSCGGPSFIEQVRGLPEHFCGAASAPRCVASRVVSIPVLISSSCEMAWTGLGWAGHVTNLRVLCSVGLPD